MKTQNGKGEIAKGGLRPDYEQAFCNYLREAGESDLVAAYELGRKAFADGVSILDMAALHHDVFARVFRDEPGVTCESAARRSGQFLNEVLSAYELGRRAYGDTVNALRHLNETLEQEVKRLAHSVHDESGQLLVAAHLAIAEEMPSASPEMQRRLNDVTELLYQAEQQLRELSHELRPTMLDDLGLVPALRSLSDSVSKRKQIEVRVEAGFEDRLAPAIEIGIYRVVQEALTNIARHAKAKKVKIELKKKQGAVRCSVEDDGVGFDADAMLSHRGKGGLGLIGIQERLKVLRGTFHAESKPGHGSKLAMSIPLGD